jgi:hypothetical protein
MEKEAKRITKKCRVTDWEIKTSVSQTLDVIDREFDET